MVIWGYLILGVGVKKWPSERRSRLTGKPPPRKYEESSSNSGGKVTASGDGPYQKPSTCGL